MFSSSQSLVVVVVVTTPHTDANSIQKDNHQLSTQFKKTKRGPAFRAINTPQAKCDVHRIDVNAINNENVTFAVYRILGICDVHRI